MTASAPTCPIAEAMGLLSGRWPTSLLFVLRCGPKRFVQIRRDNPSISHRMLSLHLRKLEAVGIVTRTDYGGYPSHVEYELTEAGLRLTPLIQALGEWWSSLPQADQEAVRRLSC